MKSLDFERASKSNSFHLRPARIVSSFFFRFEPATENSTKGRHSSFMVREDLHRQKIDKCEFLVYVVEKKKKERKKGKGKGGKKKKKSPNNELRARAHRRARSSFIQTGNRARPGM